MIETRSCPRCSSWFATEQVNGEFSGICPQCLAAVVFSNPGNPSSVRISDSGTSIPISGPSSGSTLRPGSRFGGFEILDVLGEGGMGVVYKARQTSLDRIIALKVLGPRISGSEESVRRFEREAKVLATLNHPNVVQVHDFGREDGIPYLVMEHVDGESLEAALRRGRPDPAWMLRILREVARGLRRVHTAGIVHRDLKPANILITRDGTAKIGDFGLAVEARADQRLTEPGYFVGTPHYVSPEHAKGDKLDGRSDLYALGVILFEGFAGRPPFLGSSPSAVLVMHMEQLAPPLERYAPQAPAGVAAVVRRLLEKDPARRFGSASELEAALSAASIRRSAPARRAKPVALAAAAIAFLAVVGYFIWPVPAPTTPVLPFLLAADAALKSDRLDDAEAAAREARRRVENDPDWKLQVRELSDRVAEIRTDRASLRAGDDEEFGQFLCFSKGDWEHGLPMIAAGEQSPYRALARKELARPSDTAGCLAVADGWIEAAGRATKPRWAARMKERAWAWLSVAKSGADAAQRETIHRRLAELDAVLEARREIDLLKIANPAKFAVVGEFTLDGGRLRTPTMISFARMSLPYLPPDDYDLDLSVERRTGEGAFYVGLPLSSGSAGVEIEGRLFPVEKTVRVSVSLRHDKVEVSVAGTAVAAAHTVADSWRVPEPRLIVLGSNASAFVLSKVTLRGTISLPPLPAAEGSGIDLLSRLDLRRDTKAGTWNRTPRGISSRMSDKFARLQLPAELPESYDLHLTVERKAGSGALNVGLSLGDHSCCLVVDGWTGEVSGLELIDNHGADDNATTTKGRAILRRNKPVSLVCSVRPSQIQVTVDGSPLLDWKGDPARLRLHPDFILENARGLFLGASTSSFEISRLSLQPAGGRLVSGAGAADGQPTDLLALLEPKRDAVAGDWVLQSAALVSSEHDYFSRVAVPAALPEEYDLEAVVERLAGNQDFFLGLVQGRHSFGVLLDAGASTYSAIQAKEGNLDHAELSVLPGGAPHVVLCRVRKWSVEILVDGRRILGYRGDLSKGSMFPQWRTPGKQGLIVGSHGSSHRITRLQLLPARDGVDLLALLRPERDAVKGDWKKVDGVLVSTQVPEARIELPYEVPAEYDLVVTAERRSSEQRSFHLGLPIGDRGVLVTLDGFGSDRCALENLNGKPSEGDGLSYQRQVFKELGVPVTVTCRVRRNALTVWANGQAVLAWTGDPRTLTLPGPWKGNHPRMPLLGVFSSEFHVRSARLIPVGNGNARGRGFDLLQLVAVGRDAIESTWTRESGSIVSDTNAAARVEIPYEPPAEYDLRVVWERVGGTGDAKQILVAGGRQIPWTLPQTEASDLHESVFEVRRDGVSQLVDGTTVLHKAADDPEFRPSDVWALRRPAVLGLGSSGAAVRFHRVEIVEVTGEGNALVNLRIPLEANTASQAGFTDLLCRMDPKLDTVSGTWSWKDGKLVSDATERAKIEIPYQPPQEYDFRILFSRIQGIGDVNQMVSKEGKGFAWCMGAQGNTRAGFGAINGAWAPDRKNPTRVFMALEPGRIYESVVKVRNDRVQAWLNGILVCEWATDYRDLSPDGPWRLKDDLLLGLGTFASPVAFHRVEVREVSGKGRYTRKDVDLLALVDPVRDTVAGEWTRSGTGLLTQTIAPFPRILVPYVLPEEYDITVEAERKEGIRSLLLGAAMGDSEFAVLIDGWTGSTSGLDLLDGKGADKNETTVTGMPLLPLDQRVTIALSVRKTGVLVRVEGKTIIDWKGEASRLSLHKNLEIPRKGVFIATWDSRFLIHRATLVLVNGR